MDCIKCPRCLIEVNKTTNRLITEKCGHSKCKNCFLNDIDVCLDCIKETKRENSDIALRNTFLNTENSSNLILNNSNISNAIIGVDCLTNFDENCDKVAEDNGGQQDKPFDKCKDTTKIIENIIPDSNSDNRIANLQIELKNIEAQPEFIESEEYNSDPSCKKAKKRTFPAHIVTVSEEDSTVSFECIICKKTFKSKNQRYYHLYCNLDKDKPLKCEHCSRSFVTYSHLTYHQKTHTDLGRYNCPTCSKSFAREIALKRHSKKHETTYKYQCAECDKEFHEKSSLAAHLNKHKKILPFQCKQCSKKFSQKSNLKQHEKVHSNDKKRYNCEICQKSFTRRTSCRDHLLRHSKNRNFSCKTCTKCFIDRKSLDRHIKTHKGLEIFLCPFCSVKSGRKDNLLRHIRLMHTKENIDMVQIEIRQRSEDMKSERKSKVENEIQAASVEIPKRKENVVDAVLKNDDYPTVDQIVVNSSVIRSVGNVKSVVVPDDWNVNIGQLSAELNNTNDVGNYIPENREKQITNNTSSKLEMHLVKQKKKEKKKYDPCEIYRKILLDTNDDDESSHVLDENRLHSDSQDKHTNCCNTEPQHTTDANKIERSDTNFAEMHWRKWTSQYFFSTP